VRNYKETKIFFLNFRLLINPYMPYLPGTHIIASLYTSQRHLLEKYENLQAAVSGWIMQYNLQQLGAVYHNFDPEGYTAVVCLSESHISVHTWPESGRVNLDIYLSNHQRNNDGTVKALYRSFTGWFNADILQEQTIRR